MTQAAAPVRRTRLWDRFKGWHAPQLDGWTYLALPLGIAGDLLEPLGPIARWGIIAFLSVRLVLFLPLFSEVPKAILRFFTGGIIVFVLISLLQLALRSEGGTERGAFAALGEIQAENLLSDREKAELELDRRLASLAVSERTAALRDELGSADRATALALIARVNRRADPSLRYVAHEFLLTSGRGAWVIDLSDAPERGCELLRSHLLGSRIMIGSLDRSSGEIEGSFLLRGRTAPLIGILSTDDIRLSTTYNVLDGRGERPLEFALRLGEAATLSGTVSADWDVRCTISAVTG